MADSGQLRKRHISGAQRVVVKVGTNVLAPGGGDLDDGRVAALVAGLAALRQQGRQIVLVTSGAIGCGMAELGMTERPQTLPLSQATASVGQGRLMAQYERHLHEHGLHAAQILLTHADFDSRERYLNACNTIHTLFDLPCLPVINENDTISTAEIQFGENDRLAALVTHLIRADLLVLLTSAPGLCAERGAEPLDVVERIDQDVESLVYDESTALGIGGMRTKIEACRIATHAGEAAVIADGRETDVLARLFAAKPIGTLFLPSESRLKSRKRWIRFTSRPRGTVRVDAGARRALVDGGKSLLPSGVTGVDGNFKRGDVVRIAGPDGEEFARGLSNYAAGEVAQIQGCHTAEITEILGYEYYGEVVHRDNMALLG